MSVAELLAQHDVHNHRIVRQLVARASDDGLLTAPREWNPLAIRAAGERGLSELLALADGAFDDKPQTRGAAFIARREGGDRYRT